MYCILVTVGVTITFIQNLFQHSVWVIDIRLCTIPRVKIEHPLQIDIKMWLMKINAIMDISGPFSCVGFVWIFWRRDRVIFLRTQCQVLCRIGGHFHLFWNHPFSCLLSLYWLYICMNIYYIFTKFGLKAEFNKICTYLSNYLRS